MSNSLNGFTLGTNYMTEKLGLVVVGTGDHRQKKVFKAYKAFKRMPMVVRAQTLQKVSDWMKRGYDHLMGFNFIEIARKIQVAVSKQLEPLGITFAQYRVVSRLWVEEEMTQKALGDVLTLSAATLTPMLQLMEKKGWIQRTTDELDTRSKKIRLTEAGMEIRERAFEVVMAYEREELRFLQEEESGLMLKWLRQINEHLKTV